MSFPISLVWQNLPSDKIPIQILIIINGQPVAVHCHSLYGQEGKLVGLADVLMLPQAAQGDVLSSRYLSGVA